MSLAVVIQRRGGRRIRGQRQLPTCRSRKSRIVRRWHRRHPQLVLGSSTVHPIRRRREVKGMHVVLGTRQVKYHLLTLHYHLGHCVGLLVEFILSCLHLDRQ